MSPVAATVERLQSHPPILKSKSLGVQVRDQRTLHSPVTRARRGRIMENAVALRFRLELGVAAPACGFTHAVPPRRLPLTAANSRPKQGIKINSCRASNRKTPGAGETKFAGMLITRMESSGGMRQTSDSKWAAMTGWRQRAKFRPLQFNENPNGLFFKKTVDKKRALHEYATMLIVINSKRFRLFVFQIRT